jgi:hypothetical protein
VHEISGKPHLLLRMRFSGWHFPHRAPLPFVVVDDVVSRIVIIDRDGLAANAYFDKQLPAAKRVSFGYGKTIQWDFDIAIDPKTIRHLDRARLPERIVDSVPSPPLDKELETGYLKPSLFARRNLSFPVHWRPR